MTGFLFKVRDGQTPLPSELQSGLKVKTIQTMAELDEHEEANIAKGLAWLAKQNKDPCDYAFWLELHRRLFADVWKWAGKVRTHELQNDEFTPQAQIWTAIRQLQGDLQFWTETSAFGHQEFLARFHGRIETIHPFPNGNGRFGRILVEYLARAWNLPRPTWGQAMAGEPQERRSAYIAALTKARKDLDYKPLIELMFS